MNAIGSPAAVQHNGQARIIHNTSPGQNPSQHSMHALITRTHCCATWVTMTTRQRTTRDKRLQNTMLQLCHSGGLMKHLLQLLVQLKTEA